MNLLTKTTFMIKTIYFMFFICMFAVAMVACKEIKRRLQERIC